MANKILIIAILFLSQNALAQLKTGTMTLFYGTGQNVEFCSLWDVTFKAEDSENTVVQSIREKVDADDKYLRYEFKENGSCGDTRDYLQKKGISSKNIYGCTSINFNENSNGKTIGVGYSPKPKDDAIISTLDTYGYKLAIKPMDKTIEKLQALGFIRHKLNFQQTYSNNGALSRSWSCKPGESFAIMAACTRTPSQFRVIDPTDENNFYYYTDELYKENSLMMFPDFQSPKPINKMLVGLVPESSSSQAGGVLVMKRKANLTADFDVILKSAENNFEEIKGEENPLNKGNYYALLSLGGINHKIYKTDAYGWIYSQIIKNDPERLAYTEEFIHKALAQKKQSGEYSVNEYVNENGDMATELRKGDVLLFSKTFSPFSNKMQYLFFTKEVKNFTYNPSPYKVFANLKYPLIHASFIKENKQAVVSTYDKSNNGEILLFDAATAKVNKKIESLKSNFAIFSNDGKSLFSHILTKGVVRIDIATGKIIKTFLPDALNKAMFVGDISPNGRVLATGSLFGEVYLFDIATGKNLAILKTNSENRLVLRTKFLDDNTLVTAANDLVKTWNITTKNEIVTIASPENEKGLVIDIATEAKQVLCSYKKNTYIFDALTGKQIASTDIGNFYSAFITQNGAYTLLSSSIGLFAFDRDLEHQEKNGDNAPGNFTIMTGNGEKILLGKDNHLFITTYEHLQSLSGKY